MKTFTKAEIEKLRAEGKVSSKDYLNVMLAAKKVVEQEKPKPDVLSDIRDALNKIVVLGEKEISKAEEPVVVHAAAPVVNISMPEEKEEKRQWKFTVKRDSRGFIESVTAVQQ